MDTKRKILVIDDDQSVCDMITRTLKNRGYEVFTEIHYQEGVEKAREVLPDLVFISLLLETTNGLKASKEIHAIEKLRKVPVVMLISYKGELDPKYTITIGIVDVLVKPLSERDIIAKTEDILGTDSTQKAAEKIITQMSDIDNFETVPDVPDALEGEEVSAFGSAIGTDKEIFELDEEYQDIPGVIDEEMRQTQENIHEIEDEVSELEEISEEPLDETGFDRDTVRIDEQIVGEDSEWKPVLDQGQDAKEDLEMLREEDEVNPVHEIEKTGSRKKIFLSAALLALIASIGIGTYMGLQVFSDRERSVVPFSGQEASVKDTSDLQKKKAESLPGTNTAPALDIQAKEPAAGVPEQNMNKKKAEVPTRPAVEKENAKAALSEKSSTLKEEKAAEVQKKATFSVQIGFFGNLKNAETLAEKMKQKGYKVFVKNEETAGGKMSYRVLVGKFSSRNEALEQSEIILNKEGVKTILYKE